MAKTADSGLTDRRNEIHWNINTFHFSERIIRSEPGGKREGAGLETPYELDVGILSPASIESKALAKGAHAIEKQVVSSNENKLSHSESFRESAAALG